MAVSEWYPAFLRVHLERLARKDFPEFSSEFWKLLRLELVRCGIDKFAANSASLEISVDQPDQPSQHHKRFLELAKRHQAEANKGNPLEDKSLAMAQSLNCDWCSGNGLALVQKADGEPFEVMTSGGQERESPTLVVLCKCPLAGWIRARNKFKFTELSDLLAKFVPVVPAGHVDLDEVPLYERFHQLEHTF